MKIKILTAAISLSIFTPLSVQAQTDLNTIEARLNALEKRAAAAEKRAELAEQKAAHLEQMIVAKPATQPPVTSPVSTLNTSLPAESSVTKTTGKELVINNEYGELKLYGDVEINADAASRKGQLTSVRTNSGRDQDWHDYGNWSLSGRVMIGVDGQRKLASGNFAGFSVQPLANVDGNIALDDARFYFGQKNNWQFQIGRYEAYDMFPLNQDTFVEHSGNTANDLYGDGFGYIYMMKEGRGRTNHGGSMQVSSHYYDNWYFELNTLIEDGTRIFKDNEYHGRALENKKNVIYVRPVIAWTHDNFTVAAAMDANVIRNAYGFDDTRGQFIDQSRRTGYGMTLGWNTQKQDPENGIAVNWSTAYLDAKEESDFSTGGNILWRHAQLGYIYAHNDIKKYYTGDPGTATDDYFSPGKYDIHTIYTSYEIPDILDMDNFKIYLGAYYSFISGTDMTIDSSDKNRYGTRVRFKYLF